MRSGQGEVWCGACRAGGSDEPVLGWPDTKCRCRGRLVIMAAQTAAKTLNFAPRLIQNHWRGLGGGVMRLHLCFEKTSLAVVWTGTATESRWECEMGGGGGGPWGPGQEVGRG